jgi:hypothetical protein
MLRLLRREHSDKQLSPATQARARDRVVGWSMSAAMTAQLVTDALVMAILR